VAVVTVEDNLAPVIACQPIDVTLDITGFAEVTIADFEDQFSDNCEVVTAMIKSGQTIFGCEDEGNSFPVELEIADAAGNTASCTTSINVVVVSDEDNDGVSDPCDFCEGDDSTGDSDADGICDSDDSCPGFDDLADLDEDCDLTTTLNTWWYSASTGETFCFEGPFNGGHIFVSNGSTVRLSGSGNLSVTVGWGGTLEVLGGSDIHFDNLQVGWGSDGMVVYPGATVTDNGFFATNSHVVNCGTFNANRFQVNFSGSFINNGTLNVTNAHATARVIGHFTNNGTANFHGSLALNFTGEIYNHCQINVGDDFQVFRNVYNYSFIDVADYTAVYFNGRVRLFDGAMHRTGSTLVYGKYIGSGSQSLVKVLDNTIAFFNGRIDGSVAFCDANGLEIVFANNLFVNGAEDSCLLDIAVSDCNPDGHEGFMKNAIASSGDKFNWDDVEGLLEEERPADTEITESELKLWPNPTRDNASVTYTPATSGQVSIELYAPSGQLVDRIFEGNLEKGMPYMKELHLDHLQNGIYFIRVIESGQVKTERIVITD
jgi:hypothetical protein